MMFGKKAEEAVEVWTMSKDIYFDNFYLGNSRSDADSLAKATFDLKVAQAKMNEPSVVEKSQKFIEENQLVVIIVSVLVGLPVLYMVYKMMFGKKAEEAVEVWTMSKDIYFDNFYLGNSRSDADSLAKATFDLKVAQAKMNEPSVVEKSQKFIEENQLVVIIVSVLVGLPVLYMVYKMMFGKKAEEVVEEENEKEEEKPEAEYDMVDDNSADDEEEEKEEAEEKEDVENEDDEQPEEEPEEVTAELGAGDSVIEEAKKVEESEENSENSESEDEPQPETTGPRRRTNRRKAD
jgi:flagellar basal body-associated protein FliL